MKKYFKTINGKLWFYFIVVLMGPFVLVGIINYKQTKDTTMDKLIYNSNVMLMQIKNSTYNAVNSATSICNTAYNNKHIRNYLITDLNNVDNYSYKSIDKVFEFFNVSSTIMDDICNVTIVRMDDWFTSINNDIKIVDLPEKTRLWEEKSSRGGLNMFLEEGFRLKHNNLQTIPVISVIETIYDIRNDHITGFVVADIAISRLEQHLSTIDQNTFHEILLCDGQGNILASGQQLFNLDQYHETFINPLKYSIKTVEDKKYVVTTQAIGLYDLNIIAFMPYSIVLESFNRNLGLLFIIYSIVFGYTIIITLLMSKNITNPLNTLVKSMKYNDQYNTERIQIKGSYEIEALCLKYNSLLNEIDALIEEIKVNQNEKMEIEINALQAQINPHFIYNTLSSIRWIAIIHNDSSIVKMLEAFIDFMHYSANFQESLLTLEMEKYYLEKYIYIQKVRYNSLIEFNIEFNDNTLNYRILKFVLQPLIENSIFHGIDKQMTNGKITITSRISDNNLIIEVIDNGKGIETNIMENIFNNDNADSKSNNIGIPNVDKRIRARFGEGYGLKIYSKPGEGCTAMVILPLMETDHAL